MNPPTISPLPSAAACRPPPPLYHRHCSSAAVPEETLSTPTSSRPSRRASFSAAPAPPQQRRPPAAHLTHFVVHAAALRGPLSRSTRAPPDWKPRINTPLHSPPPPTLALSRDARTRAPSLTGGGKPRERRSYLNSSAPMSLRSSSRACPSISTLSVAAGSALSLAALVGPMR